MDLLPLVLSLCCILQASLCTGFSPIQPSNSIDSNTKSRLTNSQLRIPSHRIAELRSTTTTTTTTNNNGPQFCEKCGMPTIRKVPNGDERERSCCSDPSCGFVSYQNPKIVVGAVCHYHNRILLCKRAIEPCKGKWGYPQGFLELGETTREGAVREVAEESGATVRSKDTRLLAVYNLAGAQVQMLYLAPLRNGEIKAGIESEDVGFFAWDEIPWDELAFPTVGWALEYARGVLSSLTSDPTSALIPQQRTKMYFDGTWGFVDEE